MKRHMYPALLAALVVLIGCTTTKLVETPPGSGTYQKVVEVDPKLKAGLEAASQLNEASKLFNPFSGAVSIVLGTIASLATWNAQRKNSQLDAVISGVEAKGGSEVKAAIKSAAMCKGVEKSLNKSVKAVTG